MEEWNENICYWSLLNEEQKCPKDYDSGLRQGLQNTASPQELGVFLMVKLAVNQRQVALQTETKPIPMYPKKRWEIWNVFEWESSQCPKKKTLKDLQKAWRTLLKTTLNDCKKLRFIGSKV